MSENPDESFVDGAEEEADVPSGQEFVEPVRTGVEEVDDVLESLDRLEERPVEEHVAVFEQAHERLRGALDGGPDA